MIGIDLISAERMAVFHQRWGMRGLRRVFTAGELAVLDSANGYERLAARFAAKEALIKALGHRIDFRKIEIFGGGRLRPELRWLENNQWRRAAVSLTHHEGMCAAVCLLTDV